MDTVEQRNCFVGLVRLELADKVQLDSLMPFPQVGPLGLRFLHAVFAEHTLAGSNQRLDRIRVMGLADGNQRHVIGLAPRDLRGVGNAVTDSGEAGGCVLHGAAL